MAVAVTHISADWTNKVSWTLAWSSTDADSGTLIDFSACTQIVVEIKKSLSCHVLKKTLADVDLSTPTIPFVTFTRSEMQGLCPGSYLIGAAYATADGDGQIFVGDLTIRDGVADLT